MARSVLSLPTRLAAGESPAAPVVLAALVALAALATPASLAPVPGVGRPQPVAAQAPDVAQSEGRVALVPRLGGDVTHGAARSCRCETGPAGRPVRCACDPADPAREALMPYEGVTAQNLGPRPTRFMAVFFGSAHIDAGCSGCHLRHAACSPEVAPGATWTFTPYAADGTAAGGVEPGATAATVYALNPLPARLYGDDWVAWLAQSGLDPDTSLADLACGLLGRGGYGSPRAGADDDPRLLPGCPLYEAFHDAFAGQDTLLPDTDLPLGPLRGEPMAVSVTSVTSPGAAERVVIDRYEAVPLHEAAGAGARAGGEPGARVTYVAPGGSGRTQDGGNSVLSVQNGGSACLSATVQPHRARFGPFGRPLSFDVPPGARVEVDVGLAWSELLQGAALVVEADGPLGVTLTNHGVATSATFRARRQFQEPTRWLLPRAYQEETRMRALSPAAAPALRPAGGRQAAPEPDALAANGWQTNMGIYNPADVRAMATLRQQAEGQPPRPLVDYPVETRSQVVLQPGFGLAPLGGPGWVEVTGDEAVLTVAVQSLRHARGTPALTIETWASSGWPLREGVPVPRTIGVPDLGGPALGAAADAVLSETGLVTRSLASRLAIQNPLTSTTRVAIDSHDLSCGYLGSLELAIDPRQTVTVEAAQLPGAPFGANSAVVRVLQGAAAVLVETARSEWLAAGAERVPADLTTAYLGVGTTQALEPPRLDAAALQVSPAAIELERPPLPIAVEVAVLDSAASGRCLSLGVSSGAAWLVPDRSRLRMPGVLSLTVDPARLGPGPEQTGIVTLTADQPAVDGSPTTVTVTVRSPAAGATVYLPLALAASPVR